MKPGVLLDKILEQQFPCIAAKIEIRKKILFNMYTSSGLFHKFLVFGLRQSSSPIVDQPFFSDSQEWRQAVHFCCFSALDMQDFPMFHSESIGNQAPMATPRDSFTAHECAASLLCNFLQLLQSVLEIKGLHVIGKTAKGGVDPCGIRRFFKGMAQPAESFHMPIPNPSFVQIVFEPMLAKLRTIPGFGDRSDIDHHLNVMSV